jgi:hypothetical protein
MFKSANVGTADRIVRILAGAALIAAPFVFPDQSFSAGWIRWAMQIVGAVFVLTALVRFCPLYAIFGLRTCKA